MSGTVEAVKPYGVFVELDCGPSALLHVSQISHERIKSTDDVLKEGQRVKVRPQRAGGCVMCTRVFVCRRARSSVLFREPPAAAVPQHLLTLAAHSSTELVDTVVVCEGGNVVRYCSESMWYIRYLH